MCPSATSPRSIRERLRRGAWCSIAARGSCRWRRRSIVTTSPDPAGSSTIPRRSGATFSRSSTRRWPRPSSHPLTSARSGSQTSARRRCCGTAGPGRRFTTRSSGRTRAPTQLRRELAGDAGQTASASTTGLPLATYFSGPKVRWLLDRVPGLRERAEEGEVAVRHDRHVADLEPVAARHVTDVTNASRTMLMDLDTLRLGRRAAGGDRRPAGDAAGDPPVGRDLRRGRRAAGGRPGRAALGDQHAALVGQTCFDPAMRSAPMAPAASCSQYRRGAGRARDSGLLSTSDTSSASASRRTRWRARSPSPARWCSGFATTSG